MEDFGLMFDVRTFNFYDEESGYTLHAEYVMMNENRTVIEEILAGTGVEVDDLFIEVLRDTVESMDGNSPW